LHVILLRFVNITILSVPIPSGFRNLSTQVGEESAEDFAEKSTQGHHYSWHQQSKKGDASDEADDYRPSASGVAGSPVGLHKVNLLKAGGRNLTMLLESEPGWAADQLPREQASRPECFWSEPKALLRRFQRLR